MSHVCQVMNCLSHSCDKNGNWIKELYAANLCELSKSQSDHRYLWSSDSKTVVKKFILYEVKILKYFQKKLYWYSQDLLDKCHLRCPQLGQRYQEVQSNHPQEFQLKIKLLSGTRAGTFWSYHLHIHSLQETWEIAVKVISFCNVIYLIIYIFNIVYFSMRFKF